MKKILILFLTLISLSCTKSNSNPTENDASNSNTGGDAEEEFEVIGDTKDFTVITQFEIPYLPGEEHLYTQISVDLNRELVMYLIPLGFIECEMDAERLTQLKTLMAISSICKPKPPPDDTPVCEAVGVKDIRLETTGGSSIELQPMICFSGQDLCGDSASDLREIFDSLRQSRPTICDTAME